MNRAMFPVLAAVVALAAPPAAAGVSVRVVRVEESRVKELVSEPDQGTMPSQVSLTLRVEGPEVAGATEYGGLKITEATDDTGASLKPEQVAFGDDFMPLQGMFPGREEQPGRAAEIRVSLAAPQRHAATITRVKGEVKIRAGGEKKVVTVARVKERVGKRVDDAALKAAKLTVTVVDPKAAGNGNGGLAPDAAFGAEAVSVKIVGDPAAVKQVDVVGPDGRSISQGRSSSGSGNTTVHTIMLDRAPGGSAALTIDLLVGQKDVRVPLDLKNIPLP